MSLNKNTLLSLLLLLALILSVWATRASVDLNAKQSHSEETRDAFMTDVNYISYDENGQWESSFYSPHINHFNQNDTAYLQKPLVHTAGKGNLTWKITANNATSYAGKTIELQNDVVIERINHKNNDTTIMNSTAMSLFPKQKYLKTEEPVTIKQPSSTIEAIGLEADLNTGDIKLSSEAKGVYTQP